MRRTATLTLILALASVAGAEPYTVRSGDYLGRIARRFDTSVEAIKRVNGLSNDVIHPGQVLEIPTPATEFKPHAEVTSYRVRSGDTLAGIGHKFGVPWGKIKRANGMTGNTIHPGQVLVIPEIPHDDGLPLDVTLPSGAPATTVVTTVAASAPVAAPTEAEAEAPTETEAEPEAEPEAEAEAEETQLEPFTHVVRSGNTLGKLATQYTTTVGEIKALNGLTSDVIRIGQRLRIPGQEPIDPARFHVRHAAMHVSTDALTALARLIQSEVPANAPYEGAVAVGAVVLNRVRSSRFPDTIVGVVGQRGWQKSRKRWVYQFSGYNDANYRAPVKDYAWRAAREALAGHDPVAGADHYYNPFLVAPGWARRLSFVRRIGSNSRTAHDFFHSDTVGFTAFLQGS